MSSIIKNEALILRKTKFGDTSLIIEVYSKEKGRMSALLKGARSPKSKIGSRIDLINHVEVVIYNKEDKDLQLVTQVNLINHFPHLRENLEKIKYGSAVCELILKLVPENEPNDRIFRGTVKILSLINDCDHNESYYFSQYLLFFIKEIGYELSLLNCSNCGKNLDGETENSFDFSSGIICKDCKKDKIHTYQFSEELFNLLKCLNTKNNRISYSEGNIKNIIFILEKFLIYHNSDFKEIRSLKIL